MFPYLGLPVALWLLTLPFWLASAPVSGQPAVLDPVRMATTAFGVSAEVEVRDLRDPEARAAAEAALGEIYALSRLAEDDGLDPNGVGALNRSAGKGPLAVDLRVAELLLRSLQFCIWSNGAYGPLGGELYRLWSVLREQNLRPAPGELRGAVGSTECSRLVLRSDNPAGTAAPTAATAALTSGSRVDLRGIARGFAVDRAVEVLEQHGATNVWVEIGNVLRARGGGADGRGWLATLPPPPGGEEPLDQVWLRDQALAMVTIEPVPGDEQEPLIDQRSGVPARGVVSVIAVTLLAVDAEPLVSSLFVLGHREGLMRLGSLNPRPSVYWLLGQGVGKPLEATYRWSELERIWRR